MSPLLKLLAIEELELSSVHPKKIVQDHPYDGQGNNGKHPTDGTGRPPTMIDDGTDGPDGQDKVNYGEYGLHGMGIGV